MQKVQTSSVTTLLAWQHPIVELLNITPLEIPSKPPCDILCSKKLFLGYLYRTSCVICSSSVVASTTTPTSRRLHPGTKTDNWRSATPSLPTTPSRRRCPVVNQLATFQTSVSSTTCVPSHPPISITTGIRWVHAKGQMTPNLNLTTLIYSYVLGQRCHCITGLFRSLSICLPPYVLWPNGAR